MELQRKSSIGLKIPVGFGFRDGSLVKIHLWRSDRPLVGGPTGAGGQTGQGGGLTGVDLFRRPEGGDVCELGQVHGFIAYVLHDACFV